MRAERGGIIAGWPATSIALAIRPSRLAPSSAGWPHLSYKTRTGMPKGSFASRPNASRCSRGGARCGMATRLPDVAFAVERVVCRCPQSTSSDTGERPHFRSMLARIRDSTRRCGSSAAKALTAVRFCAGAERGGAGVHRRRQIL